MPPPHQIDVGERLKGFCLCDIDVQHQRILFIASSTNSAAKVSTRCKHSSITPVYKLQYNILPSRKNSDDTGIEIVCYWNVIFVSKANIASTCDNDFHNYINTQ